MLHRPNAVGLILCERTIVEERTRNVTLVNQFTRWRVEAFPSPPQQFTAFALLRDGLGNQQVTLRIASLGEFEEIYIRSWSVTFKDRLAQARLLVRVHCSFPEAGPYEVSLDAEQETIAQCVYSVYS